MTTCYKLTRTHHHESSWEDDYYRTMTCTLTSLNGSIAGVYKLIAEDDESWTVDIISGTDWDKATGMSTDSLGTILSKNDNEELDRCYNRGEIVINIDC